MKAIASALVKAQREFSPALKTATNPHFKSKYADLAACVEAVMDALNNNGIMLMQRSEHCADGVSVETVFWHESGEFISAGNLHVPAPKNDPQGYGSALTYARRYSLMAACGIAPEDDDGNAAQTASRPAPYNPPKPPVKAPATVAKDKATPEQQQALWVKCLEAAKGDTVLADEILKVCSAFTDARGNEQFLSLAKLATASEKYVSGTMRNFDKVEYQQKIADLTDAIPF